MDKRSLVKAPVKPADFYGLDKLVASMGITDAQLAYLIGNSFRQTLADVVFMSQQIVDLGVLRNQATRGQRSARLSEASKISFVDYMNRIVMPYYSAKLHKTLRTGDLINLGDLQSIRSLVASDAGFRMIHTNDDFLSRPADIQAFSRSMGARATVFTVGGHVGNLWSPGVAEGMKAAVQDLL